MNDEKLSNDYIINQTTRHIFLEILQLSYLFANNIERMYREIQDDLHLCSENECKKSFKIKLLDYV